MNSLIARCPIVIVPLLHKFSQVNTVLVLFPDGNQVVVPFKDDTLLLQLLPRISKLKKLRLYTNEYVFSVSAADQKHLKVKIMWNMLPNCCVKYFDD